MEIDIEKLLYEDESPTLDFKKDQYPFERATNDQKSELLKDILAFVNAWRRTEAIILIGVEEVKGGRSIIAGIDNDLDDASLQQFVNSKTQSPVNFEYKSFFYQGKKIGLIRIPVQARPIYLKDDFGKLKAKTVYIRRGSSTAEAEPDEIARMGAANVQLPQVQPNILIEFADLRQRKRLGKELQINLIKLLVPPKEKIPDYTVSSRMDLLSIGNANSNFYRELADYYFWLNICKPLGFYLENISETTARSVKVELSVLRNGNYGFISKSNMPKKPFPRYDTLFRSIPNISPISDVIITKIKDKWIIEFEIDKLQPKNYYYSSDEAIFFSYADERISVEASIYSDNLSSPIKDNLVLVSKVIEEPGELDSLLNKYYKYAENK